YYFKQFEPNNQMSLYTLAGQVTLHSPIRGVIIDGIQILIESTNFKRHVTYRTPEQTEEWITDAHVWFTLAKTYAETNYWPMNDTACDKYGGCEFREICSKSPQVRDKFLALEFDRRDQWNPLQPR